MTTLADALAPRSDQLNADDLIPGPRVLKITAARVVKDGRDTKIVLNYEGDNGKPWKPCKTMGRAMVIAWAIADPEQFVGKSVRVYRDPEVRFGEQGAVGGIRISHLSHIDKPAIMKLTVSQGKKGNFTFNPLVTQVAEDRAAKFTAAFVNAVTNAADLDALDALIAQHRGKLDDLQAKRPELATDAFAAFDARAAELSAAREGRTDQQHGDQHTDDDEEEF